MQGRGRALAAAVLALAACKTSSGGSSTASATRAGDEANQATRDGQREAVEVDPQAGTGHELLQGRVALVDAQAREIAIDSGQSTRQVRVDPAADITIDGRKASFADLKQGQEVRVSLDRTGDGSAARRIEVTHANK